MDEVPKIVFLDPPETIVFTGDTTTGRSMTNILMTNPTSKRVYFKVKTTKPLRYCVSPAVGLMDENTVLDLLIRLKEKGIEPEQMRKDKFLIQTIYEEDALDVGEDAMAAFVDENKPHFVEHKLYVTSENANLAPEDQKHADSASFRSASPSDGFGQENMKAGVGALDDTTTISKEIRKSNESQEHSKHSEEVTELKDENSNPKKSNERNSGEVGGGEDKSNEKNSKELSGGLNGNTIPMKLSGQISDEYNDLPNEISNPKRSNEGNSGEISGEKGGFANPKRSNEGNSGEISGENGGLANPKRSNERNSGEISGEKGGLANPKRSNERNSGEISGEKGGFSNPKRSNEGNSGEISGEKGGNYNPKRSNEGNSGELNGEKGGYSNPNRSNERNSREISTGKGGYSNPNLSNENRAIGGQYFLGTGLNNGFDRLEDFNFKWLVFSILLALLGFLLGYYYHEQIEMSINNLLGNYQHCTH